MLTINAAKETSLLLLKENDSTLPTDGVRVNWPLEEEGTSTLRDGYSDCQNDPGTRGQVSH